VNGHANVICDLDLLVGACPGPTRIDVQVQGTATTTTGVPCIYGSDGKALTTSQSTCFGTIKCQIPTECRTTGGGDLYNGDRNDDCVTVVTTLSPLSVNGVQLDHVSHGGQLGAPYANKDCAQLLADPCIRGQWQHNRHFQGKGNARNVIEADFHSNTPKGVFDTLKCECLGCCGENTKGGPNGVPPGWLNKKYELCNPDDHRVCGPEPRPAPANALIWSGMGTSKFTTDAANGNKSVEWVVIRVYVEDRSEPGGFHPKGSVNPGDIYVFQAWRTGILVDKKADPNALDKGAPGSDLAGQNINAFRASLSLDSCNFIQSVSKTGTCPPGTLPPATVAGFTASVNDSGTLRHGNRQIHPVTGATCTATGGIPVNFQFPAPQVGPYCPPQ
jgi:hypothetical protein